MSIVNMSACKFINLDALPKLPERVLGLCETLAPKGSILLAPKGINQFLAGSRNAIDALMRWLHSNHRFADIRPKESLSEAVPFGRMRVRLKKAIITVRMTAICSRDERAPAVDAATLQRWLAQGHEDNNRDVEMLDTRNDFETDMGAFNQAVDYRLDSYTDFPKAIAADRPRYEGKSLVPYRTGGIRCEKALLHRRDLGMEPVNPLESGILTCLECTDGTRWHGDCFVFDGREARDPELAPAATPLAAGQMKTSMRRAEPRSDPWLMAGMKDQSRVDAGAESKDVATSLPPSKRPSRGQNETTIESRSTAHETKTTAPTIAWLDRWAS